MHKTEQRDGMIIEWDVPIPMEDGIVLRADVYRPIEPGRYPVLMSHGPYAKGLPMQTGYAPVWRQLTRDHPDAVAESTNKYQSFEVADPECWVPYGYICIRVDSRGSGRSQGYLDCLSARETKDYYNCIEWAAVQSWSSGKIGLTGISYYAVNQWQVAALKPPHLHAICPFEGFADLYRDTVRHGGILCSFMLRWYPIQVESIQHGAGDRAPINPNTGESIAGPETEAPEVLKGRRADLTQQQVENVYATDSYYQERTPVLEDIEVPMLSRGNWGGLANHLRGNVEAFMRSGSKKKWLEMHNFEHWTEFYTTGGRTLMRRFFDHFLKGEDNGWDREPPLMLNLRRPDGFIQRTEHEWPLARTNWTHSFLDAASLSMGSQSAAPAQTAFQALSHGVTFWGPEQEQEVEITGPVSAKLFVSSSTANADIFLTLRAFGPNGREVLFAGATDPNNPVSFGWLRASRRKLDLARSLPYRPWHVHDEDQLLVPGDVYELDIEIWPTSIILPRGYRLALTVAGQDFDHRLPEPLPSMWGTPMHGCSIHLHDVDSDRPADVFGGMTTIHTGGEFPSSVLLPVIPNHNL
ncbi:CocE/NonD family hydrolase [Paraburkholderia sediminicola]|uniref:CocE/NonD family hydrolase n=1 Tax=Paraburkholderia sediminicola TaxID=458836 RepID=UPI0038B81DF1